MSVPGYSISRQLLADLLREAKKAHSVYEEQLGYPDENWPVWYAEYILDRLSGDPETGPLSPGLE